VYLIVSFEKKLTIGFYSLFVYYDLNEGIQVILIFARSVIIKEKSMKNCPCCVATML
jgi:hypothetical protein